MRGWRLEAVTSIPAMLLLVLEMIARELLLVVGLVSLEQVKEFTVRRAFYTC